MSFENNYDCYYTYIIIYMVLHYECENNNIFLYITNVLFHIVYSTCKFFCIIYYTNTVYAKIW